MRTLGVLLTVLTVVLSACGPQRPPPVDFNPTDAKVTSIALLDPGIPERPLLHYVGPASGASIIGTVMLGPLGAVATLPIERAAHERIQTEFATVVAARSLNVREELAGGLERSLREHGYNVIRVQVRRPLKGETVRVEDWLETYPPDLAAGQNAILDVTLVAYGYGMPPSTDQYRPLVAIGYRLVRPGTGEVLLRKGYSYASVPADAHPDDAFAIRWQSDIAKDPGKVNAGLTEGLRRAVKAVADSLKPGDASPR